MIAKTFIIAKTFRAHGTNSLPQEKSLRDHGDALGRPALFDVTRVGQCTTSPDLGDPGALDDLAAVPDHRVGQPRARSRMRGSGYEVTPYSIAVAAEAWVAPTSAEAAPNSERPMRMAKMIFRVNFMTGPPSGIECHSRG